MDESRGEMATMAPEIRLIGWLLLFGGILGALRSSVYLWYALTLPAMMFWAVVPDTPGLPFPQGAPPHLLVLIFEALLLVFNLAGIIAGIGLLRHVRWARRMAVVTLIGLIAAVLLPTQIENVRTLLQYTRDSMLDREIWRVLWTTFLTLFSPLSNVVMLVFLESPRALASWDEMSGQPNRLQTAARGVLARFSTPPVITVIALLLICQGLPEIFNVWRTTEYFISLCQHAVMASELIAQGTVVIMPVLTILAGLCLLRQTHGAAVLAFIVMVANIVLPVIAIVALSSFYTSISKIPATMITIGILALIPLLSTAIMVRYLLAHRKPSSPPTPASYP